MVVPESALGILLENVSGRRTSNLPDKKTLSVTSKLIPVSHQYNPLPYLNNPLLEPLYEQNI